MPIMAHDVQYAFDSAVELGYITADVSAYFHTYHPNPNKWYDDQERESPKGWREIQKAFEDAATEAYLAARCDMPLRHRIVCSYEGLLALNSQTEEVARGVICDMLDQVPEGGLTKRARRWLLAPAAIRRAAKADPWQECTRTRGKLLMERAKEDSLDLPWSQKHKIAEWINEERIRFQSEHERVMAAVLEQISQPIDLSGCRAAFDKAVKERRSLERLRVRAAKRRRKVLARSFTTLAQVAGQETARMFLGGDFIRIDGRAFSFLLRRRSDPTATGHSGLEIKLADRASGEELTHLCLYFEDTPALDQVAAIAMHVAAGEEDDLIRTGNFYSVKEAAASHPALLAIKPPPDRRIHVDDVLPRIPRSADEAERDEIRRKAVPICTTIVQELIHPRLPRMVKAAEGRAMDQLASAA